MIYLNFNDTSIGQQTAALCLPQPKEHIYKEETSATMFELDTAKDIDASGAASATSMERKIPCPSTQLTQSALTPAS
jgi:hypothetical protein